MSEETQQVSAISAAVVLVAFALFGSAMKGCQADNAMRTAVGVAEAESNAKIGSVCVAAGGSWVKSTGGDYQCVGARQQ